MLAQAMMRGAAGSSKKLYVDDVFSTYLYTGNGSTQTITNGIDLAGEGGLVWIKDRNLGTKGHHLVDTASGASKDLQSQSTNGQITTNTVTAFGSAGFSIQTNDVNDATGSFVSWTFRKAPKFFDVVTYTGDGSGSQTIAHSLASQPGFILIKRTDNTSNWVSLARSDASNYTLLYMNLTNATAASPIPQTSAASSTNINVGYISTKAGVNTSGATYVAYIFAHDTEEDGMIQCGSYTGNGSATGPEITLGWEPQYVLIKAADIAQDWFIADNMRGMSVGSGDEVLLPNTSAAMSGLSYIDPIATGFKITSAGSSFNSSGVKYIYLAIRRPNKPPTSGSEVFASSLALATDGTANTPRFTCNFITDLIMTPYIGGGNNNTFDRLRGASQRITTQLINAEDIVSTYKFDINKSVYGAGAYSANSLAVGYLFKRAKGFFDVVCYTGTGVARTVTHGLGVVPELMIVKARNAGFGWPVYVSAIGAGNGMQLELTSGSFGTSSFWNSTAPTTSTFTVGTNAGTNNSGTSYVAYLFASLPGISKVGSYTGNGSSQTINCGFSAGARFILIKRTDSTGDWYVWDSTRGIIAANDPHLSLNTTAAEVTTDDSIDPTASGFIVNQVAATNINVSGGSYIFLSIA